MPTSIKNETYNKINNKVSIAISVFRHELNYYIQSHLKEINKQKKENKQTKKKNKSIAALNII
jgi:hypothetical protein